MKTKLLLSLLTSMLLSACAGPAQDNQARNNKGGDGTGNSQSQNVPSNLASTTDAAIKADTEAVYHIILNTDTVPGRLDTKVISGLSEPLRALAAFYAAMGGTNCDGENCELTTALRLGKQGSEKQKALISNYFPDDKVAETVLQQDCYLRPSGASTFSDFEYLTITKQGDSIKVDYNLMHYNRGSVTHTEGPDVYLLKDDIFKKLKRNLWAHVEQ